MLDNFLINQNDLYLEYELELFLYVYRNCDVNSRHDKSCVVSALRHVRQLPSIEIW